jgi:hypothetical protein
MSNTQRFVSLYGFFAFNYPNHWTEETDESGHYIFYNNNGGQGALRVMLLPNEFEGDDAPVKMLEEVYNQNRDFNPSLYAAGENRFVSFAKEHEVNGGSFTVYYWATCKFDKVVLFTFTVQTALKSLPALEQERQEVEDMIGTFEFLSGEGHTHQH